MATWIFWAVTTDVLRSSYSKRKVGPGRKQAAPREDLYELLEALLNVISMDTSVAHLGAVKGAVQTLMSSQPMWLRALSFRELTGYVGINPHLHGKARTVSSVDRLVVPVETLTKAMS